MNALTITISIIILSIAWAFATMCAACGVCGKHCCDKEECNKLREEKEKV